MKSLNLPSNVTAVYEEFPNGSEVNLFRHNDFLGRRWFPEVGKALENRLQVMNRSSKEQHDGDHSRAIGTG